jgi:putative ABC transport system permease protein
MTIPDLILTANKNLLTNKVRTILTILAIFVGALSIAITAGLSSGVKTYINDQVEQFKQPGVLTVRKNFDILSAVGISSSVDNEKLEKYKPVDEVIPRISKNQASNFKKDFPDLKQVLPSYNIIPEYVKLGASNDKYTMTISEYISTTDYNLAFGKTPTSNDEITISSKTAKSFGYNEIQNSIGKTLNITYLDVTRVEYIKTLKIVGVLNTSLINDNLNLVSPEYNTQVNNEVNNTNLDARDNYYAVTFVFDKNISESRLSEVKSKLNEQKLIGETSVESIKPVLQVIDQISLVLYIFGAVVLLASLFGVINTLLMSILERTKEIGLMRSLGMSQRGIFTIFSLEAMSLGFWGSFLGCLVISLGSIFVNNYASQNLLKGAVGYKLIYLDPLSWLAIMSGVMLITFIAGVLPSIKASKQNPITALRSE